MKRSRCNALIFSVMLLTPVFSLARQESSAAESRRGAGSSEKIVVCTMVFDALGKIGDTAAKDVLIPGLKSGDFFLRAYAAEALGELGDKGAIPALKGVVDDKNYLVRIAAVSSLVKLGDTSMEKTLLGFLDDKNVSVRAAAVAHCDAFGNRSYRILGSLLLDEKDPLVRAKALVMLSKPAAGLPSNVTGADPLMKVIINDLNSSDWQVRRAACVALAKLKDKKAIQFLIAQLGDPSSYVRAAAKEGLGSFGETSLIKFFWQDVSDPDPVLKISSFNALAQLNDIDLVPVVIKELTAPMTTTIVRRSAARALSTLRPRVNAVMDNSFIMSKTHDVLSLRDLSATYSSNGRALNSIFIDALLNASDPMHSDAPFVLKELGDDSVLPALREGLSSSDPDIVAACAYALGEMRDKAAVAGLMEVSRRYHL